MGHVPMRGLYESAFTKVSMARGPIPPPPSPFLPPKGEAEEDKFTALTERIERLEIDLSKAEEIINKLLENEFRVIQGGGTGNLDDDYNERYLAWCEREGYKPGKGLVVHPKDQEAYDYEEIVYDYDDNITYDLLS